MKWHDAYHGEILADDTGKILGEIRVSGPYGAKRYSATFDEKHIGDYVSDGAARAAVEKEANITSLSR